MLLKIKNSQVGGQDQVCRSISRTQKIDLPRQKKPHHAKWAKRKQDINERKFQRKEGTMSPNCNHISLWNHEL